jgi:CRP-like cAMP-binding protein
MKPEIYNAITNIHQRLHQLYPITLDEVLLIAPIVEIVFLKSGENFISPGQSSQKIGMMIKGLAKTYYISENGKEHISQFGAEGTFLGVYTDMLKNISSTGYIETLEDSIIIEMDYQKFSNAINKSLSWAHIMRLVTEQRYIYRSDKDRNINLKSASERYEYFLTIHHDLEHRLQQNQIALYLNITPATLSRLKNKSGKYKDKL